MVCAASVVRLRCVVPRESGGGVAGQGGQTLLLAQTSTDDLRGGVHVHLPPGVGHGGEDLHPVLPDHKVTYVAS